MRPGTCFEWQATRPRWLSLLDKELVGEDSHHGQSDMSTYYKILYEDQEKCFKLGLKYGAQLTAQSEEQDEEEEDTDLSPYSEEDIDVDLNPSFKDLLDVALFDPDPIVRQQAQKGVRELYPGGPKGFDDFLFQLIEGLRDPTKKPLSMMTIPMYGEMALPNIRPYLKDPDAQMRVMVTNLIGEIEKNKPK
jgi:hypothetical protein